MAHTFDLSRAPYVLYGVTDINLVSLAPSSGKSKGDVAKLFRKVKKGAAINIVFSRPKAAEPEPAATTAAATTSGDGGDEPVVQPDAHRGTPPPVVEPKREPEEEWLFNSDARKNSIADLRGSVFDDSKEWKTNTAPETFKDPVADMGSLKSKWETHAPRPQVPATNKTALSIVPPAQEVEVGDEAQVPDAAADDEEDWTVGFGNDYIDDAGEASASRLDLEHALCLYGVGYTYLVHPC